MNKLVLLRHGQSVWNKEGRFTGWTDVDLTEQGVAEAREAGQLLEREGYTFDIAYTSVLKRAIRTLWIGLDEMELMWIPVEKDWRLNERHYGALQGLDKKETVAKHGMDAVQTWRRSYATRPPLLAKDDDRFPGLDPRYAEVPPDELPRGECLKDTVERFIPYWKATIAPDVASGKKVLIAAHGNSLRALVKYVDDISNDEIMDLNIPTGIPLVYELEDDLSPVRHYYLGDPEKVKAATQVVASQLEKRPD